MGNIQKNLNVTSTVEIQLESPIFIKNRKIEPFERSNNAFIYDGQITKHVQGEMHIQLNNNDKTNIKVKIHYNDDNEPERGEIINSNMNIPIVSMFKIKSV